VPDGDIVVATWWETAEWVWGMPAEKGLKVHFIQGYEAFSWMPRERVHAVWQLPFRKIVVSRWLQGIAESDFGDFQSVLVPNGIDTHRFTPSCQGERNCTVGGLFSGMGKESIKRFWLAAEVVEILQKRRHNLRFVVFGSRPPQSHEQLPRGTCFEFAPAQERIPEIYSSCACWLFTSKEEGYGLPILEAMACGTPVVATPAGAAPELLASGGGTLVNSDDPEAIADAVEAILNLDEASWQAISRAARAEAEKHSWDLIGDKMESALLQILSEGR
jgi:glycosyltransferase involved in cell wall biosynthesis